MSRAQAQGGVLDIEPRVPSRSPITKGVKLMSGLEWFLGTALAVLYLFCIFTVGLITFRKGHFVLGVLGIFLPFLWLIGAVLPDRGGGMTATM
jgi:hypothetical protein